MEDYSEKKYNYAHILWHDELKFNTLLVEFLNRYFCEENKIEHVFYTPYINVYENLKHHNNVFYFEQNNPKSSKIVNFVGKQANWIFLHNICESIELLKIHPRYIKNYLENMGRQQIRKNRIWKQHSEKFCL